MRVSYVLRENAYPFLALVVLKQGRQVVCERIEGACLLEELLSRLRLAIIDNEGEFVVERAERNRRMEDQQLREAQDQAFQESLAADREKERQKEESLSRARQLAHEEEESRMQEALRKEVCSCRPFLLRSSLVMYVIQEFEIKKAQCSSRLPPEPNFNDPEAMQVMLRLPSGHRLERCFRNSDKLQVCINL